MTKFKIKVNRGKCKRCGYCYSMDPAHFERAPVTGLFEKAYARFAKSLFLNKSRVIGGTCEKNISEGTFDDD